MPRAIYRGPGDYVELDGIRVNKGKGEDLTPEQISRIEASDPEAVIDVVREKGKTDARTV